MKKKLLFAALAACLVLGGCGLTQTSPLTETSAEEIAEESVEESTAESSDSVEQTTVDEETEDELEAISVIEGIMRDKMDFMFTIETFEGDFYALAFDEKLENYDSLNDGDEITVSYTGELSEVDAFTGQIISMSKIGEN